MRQKASILFLSIIAAIFIVLTGIFVIHHNNIIKEGREQRKNKNMLQSIITKTDNNHPAINESLKGKTIVINVWASWCQPCWNEIPELNELQSKYEDDHTVFIALNGRKEEGEREAIKDRNINFGYDLYFDQGEMIDFLYSYKLDEEKKALPLNIIIDKNGKAALYYMGYHSDKIEAMQEYLETQ